MGAARLLALADAVVVVRPVQMNGLAGGSGLLLRTGIRVEDLCERPSQQPPASASEIRMSEKSSSSREGDSRHSKPIGPLHAWMARPEWATGSSGGSRLNVNCRAALGVGRDKLLLSQELLG